MATEYRIILDNPSPLSRYIWIGFSKEPTFADLVERIKFHNQGNNHPLYHPATKIIVEKREDTFLAWQFVRHVVPFAVESNEARILDNRITEILSKPKNQVTLAEVRECISQVQAMLEKATKLVSMLPFAKKEEDNADQACIVEDRQRGTGGCPGNI